MEVQTNSNERPSLNFLEEIIENWKTDVFENEFNDIKDYVGQDFLDKALKTTQVIDEETKKLIK